MNVALSGVFLATPPVAFLVVDRHPWAAAALWPWTTFAFTGLFILAHEGIHGTLLPGHPRAGHGLARVLLFAYAFLD